jgi:hypothetical protein
MQDIGTRKHRAASRFAVVAQEAAVDRDLPRALDALGQTTQHCIACRAGFRLQKGPAPHLHQERRHARVRRSRPIHKPDFSPTLGAARQPRTDHSRHT